MDKAAASEKTLSLHVNKAPCTEILRSLAEMTGKNIVFSGTITETVTADLDKVTPEEAISLFLPPAALPGGQKEAPSLSSTARWKRMQAS